MTTTIRKSSRARSRSAHAGRARRLVAERSIPAATHVAAKRVLLALDGSRPSNAAMRFARRMAVRGAWTPEALTVAEPVPVYVGDIMLPTPAIAPDLMTGNLLLGLKSQLRRHGLPTWGAHVRIGPTVHSIVDMAREGRFEMIVMGLGQHGRFARLFGTETACRVAARAPAPMLAVHPSLRGLIDVAVVAVDFGASSERAAREAFALLEPRGRLHLVHVLSPFNYTPMADGVWRREYEAAVDRSFDRLIEKLGIDPARVSKQQLHGTVVDAIARYARSAGADLIAAGRHNQGLIERMMLGTTPAELLRAARCSVLITPPDET